MSKIRRSFSTSQVERIVEARDKGLTYTEIAKEVTELAGYPVTGDRVSSAYRRFKNRPKAAKKKATMGKIEPRAQSPNAKVDNSRILVISDLHVPYHHPDSFAFLAAVAEKYKPTRIVCIGDEVDHHAMSFHDSDPDLLSAGEELRSSIKALKPLYKLFPNVDLIDSNHGSMAFRKGKHFGIPRKYLRDYGDVLESPTGWNWHGDLTLTLSNGSTVYFHHGLSADVMKVVNQRGTCVVQGHYHLKFCIGYSGNPESLLWGMNVGCSIDTHSMAFAYDKTNLGRPVIGHGIIIDGQPKLLPMILHKGGRWTKVVP